MGSPRILLGKLDDAIGLSIVIHKSGKEKLFFIQQFNIRKTCFLSAIDVGCQEWEIAGFLKMIVIRFRGWVHMRLGFDFVVVSLDIVNRKHECIKARRNRFSGFTLPPMGRQVETGCERFDLTRSPSHRAP